MIELCVSVFGYRLISPSVVATRSLQWGGAAPRVRPGRRGPLHGPAGPPEVHLRDPAPVHRRPRTRRVGELAPRSLRHLPPGAAGAEGVAKVETDDEDGQGRGSGHYVHHVRLH